MQFPAKRNAGCHSRQKRRMQMNVTFYLALHRDGGESVGLTFTLTKTVKISVIDGLPCLPYTFYA